MMAGDIIYFIQTLRFVGDTMSRGGKDMWT